MTWVDDPPYNGPYNSLDYAVDPRRFAPGIWPHEAATPIIAPDYNVVDGALLRWVDLNGSGRWCFKRQYQRNVFGLYKYRWLWMFELEEDMVGFRVYLGE